MVKPIKVILQFLDKSILVLVYRITIPNIKDSKMKKLLFIYSIMIFAGVAKLSAQQLAQSTFVEEAKHYWNPAATGVDEDMRTSLFFRQQWLGFGSSAPRTGFMSIQYPFIDMNMSAGAIINFDQTGPVSKKGLQLTYAYKLKGALGDESQLSLGINAGFQQYVFSPSAQVFNDVNDKLLQGSNSTALYPAIGAGIYYLSSTREYDENILFVGFAFRNAFATDVLINDNNQLRERHIHFNIGTRVYQPHSFIEPSITVNYTNPDMVDIRAGLRYEMEDAFWAGLGYATNNEVSFQGGIVVPRFGDRYGSLRIGGLGNFGISDNLSSFGPGLEIFVGYAYDLK